MTNDSRTYATPAAFRQALEARLRRHAEERGEELMRIRRQVSFDRLLARVFADQDGPWALKGGYALQLRFAEARTTRDVDLSLRTPAGLPPGSTIPRRLQEELQRLGNLDAGDFFVFVVESATLDIDAAPYGGARFPVDARLAGRTFVKFHVDIGIGKPVTVEVDDKEVSCRSTLDVWLAETRGIRGIPTPYHAPNAAAHVERFIGTLRRELLDRILVWNERQLRAVVNEYVRWFNEGRVHQGIHGIPDPDPELAGEKPADGKLVARPVCGGIQHDYRLAA